MKKSKLVLLFILFPFLANAGEWYAVDGGVAEIDLKEASIENKLWNYIAKNSSRKFEPRADYTYQYQVISKGKIKINAMCSVEETDDLNKAFIYVDDGGSCYFEVIYNSEKGLFEKLYVNGWA